MTHKQTWLTIAEAFATPPKYRTERQGSLDHSGLCWASHYLGIVGAYEIIDSWLGLGRGGTWLPLMDEYGHTREHDLLRCLQACFFAAMSKKEFEQLLGSPQ